MTKSLFISLPVTDLAASTAFYKALGFSQNPQFSSEDGSAMVWSEAIQVILVTHAKWRTFTQRPLPPAGSCGLMLSLRAIAPSDHDAVAILPVFRCAQLGTHAQQGRQRRPREDAIPMPTDDILQAGIAGRVSTRQVV